MIGDTSQIFTSSEEILDFILSQSLNGKKNFIEEVAAKYKNVDIDPDFINFRNIVYDITKIDYWESLRDTFTFEFGDNVVPNFKYYVNVPFQDDNNFLRGEISLQDEVYENEDAKEHYSNAFREAIIDYRAHKVFLGGKRFE